MVYFGGDADTGGLFAGEVQEGRLDAPLFLFEEGAPIYGTVVKDGYWSRDFVLPNGISAEPFHLPSLMKKTRHAAALMMNFTNVSTKNTGFGFGASFEYRFYPLPDRLFFKGSYSLRTERGALDQAGRGNLTHELRIGIGVNLLPVLIPFRLIAGTGVSATFNNGANFLADPLWLGAEYHFSRFAITGEVRLPALFSYSRDVFGAKSADKGVCISFGVMLKW